MFGPLDIFGPFQCFGPLCGNSGHMSRQKGQAALIIVAPLQNRSWKQGGPNPRRTFLCYMVFVSLGLVERCVNAGS